MLCTYLEPLLFRTGVCEGCTFNLRKHTNRFFKCFGSVPEQFPFVPRVTKPLCNETIKLVGFKY